jgi:methyltransferase
VTLSVLVLAVVTLQRLAELALAHHNTARLLELGAVEAGAGHYPLLVTLHAAWLSSLWLLAWDVPPDLFWLGVFVVLQVARVWIIVHLGSRWTTRIIVLPRAPLVRTGPYRFLSHPNYVVVAGEIAVLPLVFGLAWHALLFSFLNAAVLAVRIRSENEALARLASGP